MVHVKKLVHNQSANAVSKKNKKSKCGLIKFELINRGCKRETLAMWITKLSRM